MDGQPCAYYGERVQRRDVWRPPHDALPEVAYTYRPLTMRQIAEYDEQLNKAANAEAVSTVVCRFLAAHLTGWNLVKPDGGPVDCRDVKELGRVDHNVLTGLMQRIRDSRSVEEAEEKNSDAASASS
ncbi:MAG TPA: hypothetical protein VMZ50_14385 [Phycisphaerae bacterium]|nr:hypothetical protein [Phycisphaerae bacterium]